MQSAVIPLPFSEDEQSLSYIIKNGAITAYFQPIFDLMTGDAIGHEALSRGPEGSALFSPDQLFQTAVASGRLHELELLCRGKSLQRFSELALPGKLFLNISASLLSSVDHQKGMTLALLEAMDIPRDRIIIELSEQHPYDHFGLSRASVEYYRRMGFEIAIDDLGVGYSGLRLWSELQPEYVKIDKHFISGVDKDAVKREFVRSIIAIANTLQCKIIAEGIETQSELDMLMALGVTLGQGYLLGYPVQVPDQFHNKLLVNKALRSEQKSRLDAEETVISLSQPVLAVNEDVQLKELHKIFKEKPGLHTIPVLANGMPVGVVRRNDLLELFSTQYGRALDEHKTVSRLLKKEILVVESDVSLSKVSRLLTTQDSDNIHNEIIIVQEGCYLGMGRLRDLLKRITELKIQNATYANPLTLLPGNVPINIEVNRCLKQARNFRVAYFDLNDFKPFNDYYGYAQGDQVIQLLGRLIKQHATHADNFIGHIGGDDFVVVFGSAQWEESCQAILKDFAKKAKDLYAPKEREEGGLWGVTRSQERVFHNIISLAVGVVNPDSLACESHLEVSELAAEAKKAAKNMGGNALFLSRRRKIRLFRANCKI
ncbi:GGDEF domain-containing protein [Neptunomonas antarctica]|uniref:Diguanylate cyclase/phosphodiesterase n=1 Tax=Neptunomonas antarctica TaxID=619304 RepID=A0A1N7J731_9GAMM|nr:GGDEF domain-containing protein [Neptunomonas antarctica]SIS45130.1 diguanylate cyclase/phosphodiesterase [Neptunomonas antarctica]